MALSDKRILEAIANDDIFIHPFNRRNLATSSYDVRLGEFYFAENPPEDGRSMSIYDIYSEEDMLRVWGSPMRAQLPTDVLPLAVAQRLKTKNRRIIMLAPGETILAHTQEFIGGRNHLTTMMKARSSFGRNFIEDCKCAGWGDVGFVNRWTMEITNNARYRHIPLVVGMRIAQIIFFETGAIIAGDYVAQQGKYQDGIDTDEIMAKWRPEMMRPRLHLDWEIAEDFGLEEAA